MENKHKYKALIISFIFFFCAPLIICVDESISLFKKECLFMDQITSGDEIIYFDYLGVYHYYYSHNVYDSVKMKYLGDSNKDIFLRCYIDVNQMNYIDSHTYGYHISCYLDDTTLLNEGTYCIQIVKTLIGSINSTYFCGDNDTFKVSLTSNTPILTVQSFANGQSGCVQPGETVTLLSTFQNDVDSSQFNDYINIALSNTEVYRDDIIMKCQLETNSGSSSKIICTIPSYTPDGTYSIYYSSDLTSNNKCPAINLNSFNSLDFSGEINKLKVFKDNNFNNIISTLTNITFENSSEILGLFNLTFSLKEATNLDSSTDLPYEYYSQKNLGIKLATKSGSTINTKCDFSKSEYTQAIFYLICTPESFNQQTKYSLVILEDITIGYDKTQVLCTYGDNLIYSRIIIQRAEYDIFIIYNNNNSPYLDCNMDNNGFYFNNIISPDNICGSCGSNCLMCKNGNICFKCLYGFSLKKQKECDLDRDKIDYDKFKEIESFIPNEELCGYHNNPRQLFTFKLSYVITNGENLAIESENYNEAVFAVKENEQYGLNCIMEVNPNYIPNGEYYGTCKQTICTLNAYVNCSFNEKPSDGIYDIEIKSTNEFGNLLRKAKEEFSPLQIYYIDPQITASILDNSIQVVYKGYVSSSENIYLCPNINSKVSDCYELEDCEKSFYNKNTEETTFQCSRKIDYNESCLNFERIMVEDYCWKYTNESFVYQYCPESDDSNQSNNSSFISSINLFIFLIILLLII